MNYEVVLFLTAEDAIPIRIFLDLSDYKEVVDKGALIIELVKEVYPHATLLYWKALSHTVTIDRVKITNEPI